MKISIFSYLSYKRYLQDLIEDRPFRGRGERKKLADALGCQMAFITHVLGGDKDFNHEQALKICRYFHLSEPEQEYFLDLLSHNRAGTKELRDFYARRLSSRQAEQSLLKNRLEEKANLTSADQAEYYSHWIYGAVHMAATIPKLQTVPALAGHFGMTEAELRPVLKFLHSKGLVQIASGAVTAGNTHIFVGKDSPLVNQHHTNWRVKVMHDLKASRPEDFHYSLCFTASEKDWPLLREKMLSAIDDCLKTIRPSKEEKLGLLCVDFQGI